MKKLVTAILVLTLSFVFCASGASAGEKGMFSVSPVIMNIPLSPGKTQIYDVRVKNLLQTPLPIHVEIDQPIDTEEASGANSLASWVHIDEPDMILKPNEQKIIKLSIATPPRIPLGGYYGTLFLQPLTAQSKQTEPVIQTKVGVVILASVGVPDLSAKASVQHFSLSLNKENTKQRLTTFKVKDESLYHFSAKPILIISPLFGEAKKFAIPEKIILPGKLRTWNEKLNWPYNYMNIYNVRLLVSVGNGKQIEYKSMYFDIPYLELAVIALIIGGGLIPYSKRKNIRNAVRILVHNN